MPDFLSEEQVLVLKQTHRSLKDKRLADRIKAILYVNYGLTYQEIAKLLMFDETSLSRYVKRFKEKGVEGLLKLNDAGHTTRLDLLEELTIKNYLRDNTKRTAKEICDYIYKTYGVCYSLVGAIKLLHRLGFTYKKPKIIPGKADKVKQEEFLKAYSQIKQNLSDNASHHHSRKVKFWLKTHTRRLKLIFLPSYSPNLNIIERLWRFFHNKVTWNHYFETFEEFKYQTLKFFRNLKKYKPELETLLTDNFQS